MPEVPESSQRGSLGADDPLLSLRRVLVHGQGIASISTLPDLLRPLEVIRTHRLLNWPRRFSPPLGDGDAVLAWGRKPSAERAQAWASARGLPLLRLEDGFVRSIGLGHESPPWAVVFDDTGIYYDASQPSRLERLVLQPRQAEELARAAALAVQWRKQRVSKYNSVRDLPDLARPGDVLVVDQTWGDVSVACGLANAQSFLRMLEAALDENPHARVLLKVHPDVLAGRKRGHFSQLSPGQKASITWLAQAQHPASLLETVDKVYTVSSQMGFEALLWGRPVRCFGMPFYAGWGLTGDELPAPSRRRPATREQLTLAALVDYMRCIHPETRQPCSTEALMDWLGEQRRQRQRFPAEVFARGFSWWKRPLVQQFLAGSTVRFQSRRASLPPPGATLVLWGRQSASLPSGPQDTSPDYPTIRLEDGFLRSVGLGADLVRPLSWVADDTGIYYDTSRPSGLTELLMRGSFGPDLCARAQALRQTILSTRLSKYNLSGPAWQRPAAAEGRPVVLVVGQVESDASLRHGAPGVRTNLGLLQAARAAEPQAWLVYKPHPDVEAGLRARGHDEDQARHFCDQIVLGTGIQELLPHVDKLHVMTSLAGFEALMRGLPVVVWGCPFYAGWGLTDDRHPQARARRALKLDELVAGTLILYPRYISHHSEGFCSPERALAELLVWREEVAARRPGAVHRLWQTVRRLALGSAARWRERK